MMTTNQSYNRERCMCTTVELSAAFCF